MARAARHSVRLATERLMLLPLREDYLGPVVRLLQDESSRTALGDRPVSDPEAFALAVSLTGEKQTGPYRQYATVGREQAAFLGFVGVRELPGQPRSGELGFVLREEYWGLGYATEAVRPCVVQAIIGDQLSQVVAAASTDRAAEVLRKAGFVQRGGAVFGLTARELVNAVHSRQPAEAATAGPSKPRADSLADRRPRTY